MFLSVSIGEQNGEYMISDLKKEFNISPDDLVLELTGDALCNKNATDLLLLTLDELRYYGIEIELKAQSLESTGYNLRAYLGGTLFFSVENFLWDALTNIISFSVMLVQGNQVGAGISAIAIARELFKNLRAIDRDSLEFKAYSSIISFYNRSKSQTYPTKEELFLHINSKEDKISLVDIDNALNYLKSNHLIKVEEETYCPRL
jgi:hypothetical protein